MELLVDVRTVPASRRMPHFAKAPLAASLARSRIGYNHMLELGGLRKPKSDSINLGWRNVSFRGYADYMQTDDFWRGIDHLESLARAQATAIMCAEAVPWRCHRSLISDALVSRGLNVRHITGKSEPASHSLTPFARVEGGRLTYPGDTLPL